MKAMGMSKRSEPWAGFRSVLCPVDFSEHSRVALRYAETIASRANASVRAVYVNDPLLVAAAAAALDDRRLASRSAKELQEFVESTRSARSTKQPLLKTSVSTGKPSDEIIKAAARSRSDLIVMGTHGLTGADRLLVGSTTLGILQSTTVPVLAVPSVAEKAAASAPSPSWPGQLIVAALELEGSSDKDVDIAAHVARWFGASLLLLHVVDEIARPAWLGGDLSAHDKMRMDRAQRQLETLVVSARPDVKVEARVIRGRIAEEVAAVVATERAGLVMTALHDRRGWFGARRGSVSYHVLTQALTPVLAYPPQWRPR